MLKLSTRLGAGRAPTRGQLTGLRLRRHRLFHFLQHDEILLDGGKSALRPVEAPQPDDLMDDMLDNLPGILDRLEEYPSKLFKHTHNSSAKPS